LERGVGKTTFVLFSDVGYDELAQALQEVKKTDFEEANVLVDIDNKMLILDTDNGRIDIKFNNHDELLDAIIRIGKTLFVYDMTDTLTRAIDHLRFYRLYPQLNMTENELNDIISAMDRAKEKLIKGEFKWTWELGDLGTEYFNALVEDDPEVKKAIEDGVKKYKEICLETHGSDDSRYCDHVTPTIGATVYAIPEEKQIVIIVYVDKVGEVYRVMKGYNDAYSFLKALDEFRAITITRG
jgi:hypothetical protein